MIKASATAADGTTVVILGLSEANLDHLRGERPIAFDIAAMKLPPETKLGKIVLFYGADEATLLRLLEPMLGPDTQFHAIPRGPDTPQ